VHAEELAKTIDHTLLRPDSTAKDVVKLCREARRFHFATVCIFPYFVPLAADLLRDCDVKVCSVICFPYGSDRSRAKIAAAEQAVSEGADELDIVMNLPAMLSGEFGYVRDELAGVIRAVRLKTVNSGKGLTIVKVIIECCYLSNKMKKLSCKIVEDAGADFIKTSTGVGPQGATVADVELLRDSLSEHVGVKASGGIRSYDMVERLINAGAARIGTSSGVDIMQQLVGRAGVA
jgi:deoxyribose-phosphate aldolase